MISGLLALTLAVATPAESARCAGLDAQIARTYGFRPSQLDGEGRERKSAQMDALWQAVQSNPAVLGPCLKAALARTKDDGWLLFDGSQLLVSVDPSEAAQ
jgi:hypothetical protein